MYLILNWELLTQSAMASGLVHSPLSLSLVLTVPFQRATQCTACIRKMNDGNVHKAKKKEVY